jgi:hypothetical protein
VTLTRADDGRCGAAADGHTLLSREKIISRLRKLTLSPALPAKEDQYEIYGEKLVPVVAACALANSKPAYQLDRLVVTREMIESSVQNRVKKGKRLTVDAHRRI